MGLEGSRDGLSFADPMRSMNAVSLCFRAPSGSAVGLVFEFDSSGKFLLGPDFRLSFVTPENTMYTSSMLLPTRLSPGNLLI